MHIDRDHEPCPFCGSHDQYTSGQDSSAGEVNCRTCGAQGPRERHMRVWEAWDRRITHLQRLRGIVKKAREDLEKATKDLREEENQDE